MHFSEINFIFSDKPSYRIGRHVVFWIMWWIFFTFLYGSRPVGTDEGWAVLKMSLRLSSVEAFLYMPSHLLFSYLLIYLLIPHFLLKGRYRQLLVLLVPAVLLTAYIAFVITLFMVTPFRESMGLVVPHSNLYFGLMAGLRGGLQTGGFAATIKLMKHFYFKQRDNQQLMQEKLTAELQLLKSQVHPHFLFNTLNNLYSLTLTKSDQAPEIVVKLSNLLRYMLYECDTPRVPLIKEIRMLNSYIELEKLRYGAHLDISVSIRGDLEHKQIAPLLLLPFIENSFKHGASELLDQAWISLDISVKEDTLKFKLINSKPESSLPLNQKNSHSAGIGLANVKKRLALIYPGLHELKTTTEEDTFIVNLSLTLEAEDTLVLKQEKIRLPLTTNPDENPMPVS